MVCGEAGGVGSIAGMGISTLLDPWPCRCLLGIWQVLQCGLSNADAFIQCPVEESEADPEDSKTPDLVLSLVERKVWKRRGKKSNDIGAEEG